MVTKTTKEVKRLGIYCRVSSMKQMDNTSLENQKQRGIDFCELNGYQYEIYKDVISGSKVDRSGLNQLMDKIYSKELDGIVLYEWDRLQRQNKRLLIKRGPKNILGGLKFILNGDCPVFN